MGTYVRILTTQYETQTFCSWRDIHGKTSTIHFRVNISEKLDMVVHKGVRNKITYLSSSTHF